MERNLFYEMTTDIIQDLNENGCQNGKFELRRNLRSKDYNREYYRLYFYTNKENVLLKGNIRIFEAWSIMESIRKLENALRQDDELLKHKPL